MSSGLLLDVVNHWVNQDNTSGSSCSCYGT
jgi:hypothetical protein